MKDRWNLKRGRVSSDRRQQMIDETGAWLTWAVDHPDKVPSIRSRRVEWGGFAEMLRQSEAKAAVNYWWARTMERIESLKDGL